VGVLTGGIVVSQFEFWPPQKWEFLSPVPCGVGRAQRGVSSKNR